MMAPESGRYVELTLEKIEYDANATHINERGGYGMVAAGLAQMALTIEERYGAAQEVMEATQLVFLGGLGVAGCMAIRRGKLWWDSRQELRELRAFERRVDYTA